MVGKLEAVREEIGAVGQAPCSGNAAGVKKLGNPPAAMCTRPSLLVVEPARSILAAAAVVDAILAAAGGMAWL
jgi:hypothetical protein